MLDDEYFIILVLYCMSGTKSVNKANLTDAAGMVLLDALANNWESLFTISVFNPFIPITPSKPLMS